MDEKELQDQINMVISIDPAALTVDASDWSAFSISDGSISGTKITFDPPRENPPEDPLTDLLTASLASHFIIDRISRDELVERLLKIWPNAGGLDLSQFLDKLDVDKDAYWRKVRGEEKVGK